MVLWWERVWRATTPTIIGRHIHCLESQEILCNLLKLQNLIASSEGGVLLQKWTIAEETQGCSGAIVWSATSLAQLKLKWKPKNKIITFLQPQWSNLCDWWWRRNFKLVLCGDVQSQGKIVKIVLPHANLVFFVTHSFNLQTDTWNVLAANMTIGRSYTGVAVIDRPSFLWAVSVGPGQMPRFEETTPSFSATGNDLDLDSEPCQLGLERCPYASCEWIWENYPSIVKENDFGSCLYRCLYN